MGESGQVVEALVLTFSEDAPVASAPPNSLPAWSGWLREGGCSKRAELCIVTMLVVAEFGHQ